MIEFRGELTENAEKCFIEKNAKAAQIPLLIVLALSFPATIEIKGTDRMGILSEIVKVITEEHAVNVTKINVETNDGIFEGQITVYVHDVEDVNNLCMTLVKIHGVNSVNRVETNR